jgi:hypothetical protein
MLALLAGCAEQQTAEAPVEPPQEEAELVTGETEDQADAQPEAHKLTAYINVASGCQDWTVDLVNDLDEQYESIDVEIVDFGTPEGMKRLNEDGVSCMALLFDGSPVVRLPGEDGEGQVVTFFFPVGFGWTHEDLKQAFAGIDSGEAEILSEDEARDALAPEAVEIAVTVEETDEGASVLMNDMVVGTITEEAGGNTPMERAEATRDAIEEWTSEPVHPRQLGMTDADDGWSITGRGEELVHLYKADAKAAGVEPGKKLARDWFKAVRCGIVAAARGGQGEGVDPDLDATAPGPDGGAMCPVPGQD